MCRPFMLFNHDERDLHLEKLSWTYVPKVLIGTVGVQPVLLHIIQSRARTLLGKELEKRVKNR